MKTPKADAAAVSRAAVQDLVNEALIAHEWREGASSRLESIILAAYLRGQKSMLAPPPIGFDPDEKTPVRDVWRDDKTVPASPGGRAKKRA